MKRSATIYSLNSLQSKVNDLSDTPRGIRTVVSPSELVIRNLLNYSKALAVLKTNDTGIVNLVMN